MVRLILQLNLNLEKGLNLKFSLKEPLFILFYFKPTPEKRFQSDTQLKKNHGSSNATYKPLPEDMVLCI